jgi:hypothetical protein
MSLSIEIIDCRCKILKPVIILFIYKLCYYRTANTLLLHYNDGLFNIITEMIHPCSGNFTKSACTLFGKNVIIVMLKNIVRVGVKQM